MKFLVILRPLLLFGLLCGSTSSLNTNEASKQQDEQTSLRHRRGVECENFQGESLKDVIAAKCTELSSKGARKTLNVDNPSEWEDFVKTLKGIEDVNILIKETSLTALNFPALSNIANSKFIIQNNKKLKDIRLDIKTRTKFDELEISGNSELTSIKVAGGKNNDGFSGAIKITNNQKLGEVQFDVKVIGLTSTSDFTIVNNPMLTSVTGTWSKFLVDKFVLKDNAQLKGWIETNLKRADKFYASECTIIRNAALTTVNFGKYKEAKAEKNLIIKDNGKLEVINIQCEIFKTESLEIKNNGNLNTVTGDPSKIQEIRMIVKGNRRLLTASLQLLKKIAHIKESEIQQFGECVFEKPLKAVEELKDCQFVDGNLDFEQGAKGNSNGINLTSVNGRVDLADLPKESVGFLHGTRVHVIKGKGCGISIASIPPFTTPPCPVATTTTTPKIGKPTPSGPDSGSIDGTSGSKSPNTTSPGENKMETEEPWKKPVFGTLASLFFLCGTGGSVFLWSLYRRGKKLKNKMKKLEEKGKKEGKTTKGEGKKSGKSKDKKKDGNTPTATTPQATAPEATAPQATTPTSTATAIDPTLPRRSPYPSTYEYLFPF